MNFTLRPHAPSGRDPLDDTLTCAFRVYISAETMRMLNLEIGDMCQLKNADRTTGLGLAYLPTIKDKDLLNESPNKRIVKASVTFRDTYGFSYEDRVRIEKSNETLRQASRLVITQSSSAQNANDEHENSQELEFYAKYELMNHYDAVVRGGVFEVTFGAQRVGIRKRFLIDNIEPPIISDEEFFGLYYVDINSKVQYKNFGHVKSPLYPLNCSFKINRDGIGGLEKQIQLINENLSKFEDPKDFQIPSGLSRLMHIQPILLHGLSGTGKTLLLHKISKAPWHMVLRVDETTLGSTIGDQKLKLRQVFDNALSNQPSLVIFDELEHIAGDLDHSGYSLNPLVRFIISELERVQEYKVQVVGAVTELCSIDKRLRTPGHFSKEIEVSVPDTNARNEIINILINQDPFASYQISEVVADLTHGFVGSDLKLLCQVALDKACSRVADSQIQEGDLLCSPSIRICLKDITAAMCQVRPTATKEVIVETPNIRWADIGGPEEVKKALYKAIKRPYQRSQDMVDLDIKPTKAILLYGPPGCLKSLVVQAFAAEAGFNFIAVNGSEIASMHFSESERSIRQIFLKARCASPSMVFFDDIDYIAKSSETESHTNGKNALATLLNEMDLMRSLTEVHVLAATNKPEVLGSALFRPGFFDALLYVGLPNLNARRQILLTATKHRPLATDIDINTLAQSTEGYSETEISNICNEAAELALDEREETGIRENIGKRHFDDALAKAVKHITKEMTATYERWSSNQILTKL